MKRSLEEKTEIAIAAVAAEPPIKKVVAGAHVQTARENFDLQVASPPAVSEATMDSNKNYFDQLPDDVLLKIMGYFPNATIYKNLRLVCQRWYTVSRDKSLWRDCCVMGNRRMTDSALTACMEFADHLGAMDLHKSDKVTKQGLITALQSCKGMQAILHLPRVHIDAEILMALTIYCPDLKQLTLDREPHYEAKYVGESDALKKGMVKLLRSCPRLERLQIMEYHSPNKITMKAICAFNLNLKQLVIHFDVVSMDECRSEMHRIANLKDLRILELFTVPSNRQLMYVTEKGTLDSDVMVDVFQACRKVICLSLTYNDIEHGDLGMRSAAFFMRYSLQKLVFIDSVIRDESLLFFGMFCRRLERLEIRYTRHDHCQMYDVHPTTAGLKVFLSKLSHCLKFLVIPNCMMTHELVTFLWIRCPHVRSVNNYPPSFWKGCI